MSASSLFNELALVIRRTLSPARKQECFDGESQEQDVAISCPCTTSHHRKEIQSAEGRYKTTPLIDCPNTSYGFPQFGGIFTKKFNNPTTADVSTKEDGTSIVSKRTCFSNEHRFKAENGSSHGDKGGVADEEEVLTCTIAQNVSGKIRQNKVFEHLSALHYS